MAALRDELLPVATVITPNLPEAELLAGRPGTPAELAEALLAYGPAWVLIKGGHAEGDPVDHLFGADGDGRASSRRRGRTTGTATAPAAPWRRPSPAASVWAMTW